jgi:hypothetical protein
MVLLDEICIYTIFYCVSAILTEIFTCGGATLGSSPATNYCGVKRLLELLTRLLRREHIMQK